VIGWICGYGAWHGGPPVIPEIGKFFHFSTHQLLSWNLSFFKQRQDIVRTGTHFIRWGQSEIVACTIWYIQPWFPMTRREKKWQFQPSWDGRLCPRGHMAQVSVRAHGQGPSGSGWGWPTEWDSLIVCQARDKAALLWLTV
jgi:hypothetical protein